MVKKHLYEISRKKLVGLIIIIIFVSSLISILIWNQIFAPGYLVGYGARPHKESNDGGGGSSIGIGLIRNQTNKTINSSGEK